MSQTTAKAKLIFEGEERGVAVAAGKAEKGVRRLSAADKEAAAAAKQAAAAEKERVKTLGDLGEKLGSVGKYAGLFGAAMGAGGAAVGAALPALGALGLQLGVAKAAFSGSEKALDAYNKALEEGKGDFSEYNRLLAEMSPEQRAFTQAVVATKKPLSDLQKTAGRSFLPGVTKFLGDSQSLFPIFDRAVERTGKIMGETASKMGDLVKSEDFQQSLDDMLQSSDRVTQAIGDNFVKLTAKIIDFGGNMDPAAEGFATFLDDATAGLEGFLTGLEPHANDFKSIWESVGSVLRDVLPLAGELAGEFSAELAPILRDVAGFVRENKDEFREWIPTIAQAAVVLAGLKVASSVAGWVGGAADALFMLGAKAAGADGKVGGLVGRLGGLKAIGGAAALAAIAVAMDQVNIKAAGGAENLQGVEENLHDIVGAAGQLASLDLPGIVADIGGEVSEVNATWKRGEAPVQQWALAVGVAASDAAISMQNFFRGLVGLPPLPPLELHVDTQPASNEFLGWQRATSDGVAVAQLDADPSKANAARDGWGTATMATTATAHLNAEAAGANSTVAGWVGKATATTGTAKLNANPGQATGAVASWKGAADRTTATATVRANTGPATAALNSLVTSWQGRTIYVNIGGSRITGATGGAVTGGMIVPHYAPGGPVRGPGGPTADRVPAMLSDGEWVTNAADVKRAGGFEGMAALTDMIRRGGSSMRASAAAAMRTPPAVGGSGTTRVELVVSAGGDDKVAALINYLGRTGKLNARVA